MRCTTQPLYIKWNAGYYRCFLSPADISHLQWRQGILHAIRPRVISAQDSYPRKIIYTDASTETSVAAAIVFDMGDFMANQAIETRRGMCANEEWADLFKGANLIYGLGNLAVVQTAADPSIDLDVKKRHFLRGQQQRNFGIGSCGFESACDINLGEIFVGNLYYAEYYAAIRKSTGRN